MKFGTVFILTLTLSLLAGGIYAKGKAKQVKTQVPEAASVSEIADFKNSKAWNKVDDSLKDAWINAINTGNRDLKLECFVRVEPPADEGDQSFLISNGFIVQMFAGNIGRGHMKAGDLRSVAELPFVQKVSLAKPPDSPK